MLTIFNAEDLTPNMTVWFINGFPAKILTWTQEEWEKLNHKPHDAQLCSNGIWTALRID